MKAKTPRKPRAQPAAPTTDHLLPGALSTWAASCLRAAGLPARDAKLIAASLVQTSLWGIDSHGIARLGHYLARIEAGSISRTPTLAFKRTGPCTGQLDGGHGHGIVVCHRATVEAIKLAKRSGAGIVGVSNSSHCGAIGLYGRQVAAEGFISICFTHSDAFVAPHGGRQKFLGTNPICIAVPSGDPERPICFDMATSAVPYNRVVNYRRENRPLQPGWALDVKGRPTTDPHAVACLLPLAGHKGYGLALMIDLLCGPLNGMPFGPHIPPMYVALNRRRKLGSFFIAFDPRRFAGGASLAKVAQRFAREARAQPRAEDVDEIMVPSDPEYRMAARREREGIPIEPGLREEFSRWSTRLKIPEPLYGAT